LRTPPAQVSVLSPTKKVLSKIPSPMIKSTFFDKFY
jgi:hypothetical protein